MHDVTTRKKAMISQPMNGLTDEEIEKTRNKAIKTPRKIGLQSCKYTVHRRVV